MTKIQIASDLHIETSCENVPDPANYIYPNADVLVLAGDIGSLYKIDQLRGFLEKLSELFQAILYIPGNHEFYTIPNYDPISYNALKLRLKYLEQTIENLHILNRNSVRINNTCIVGCTLWSNPKSKVPSFIVRIHGMNTKIYSCNHEHDLRYIKKMIKYCKSKKLKLVVVTHHPPSYKALIGAKKKKRFEFLYASNLDHLLDGNDMRLWICGHTHKNIDFDMNGCRLLSNQKGKAKDKIKDYSKTLNISL
jgi:Icc-related predicted phosphoesterase